MPGTSSSANDYHFVTHWQLEGTAEETYEIIGDVEALARWWPSVYLEVKVLEPGNEQGVGKVASLVTRGWLPYILRWNLRVTDARRPFTSTLEAWGDFVGRGVWTFEPAGRMVNVTYDWNIRADKALLRYLSFLFKPIFSANHRWAMARGEECLKLELCRRRAAAASRDSGTA